MLISVWDRPFLRICSPLDTIMIFLRRHIFLVNGGHQVVCQGANEYDYVFSFANKKIRSLIKVVSSKQNISTFKSIKSNINKERNLFCKRSKSKHSLSLTRSMCTFLFFNKFEQTWLFFVMFVFLNICKQQCSFSFLFLITFK